MNQFKTYANAKFLNGQLDLLSAGSARLWNRSQSSLNNFAAVVPSTELEVISARKDTYPFEEIPDAISFYEYQYAMHNKGNRSSEIIKAFYEKKVRGPQGTNALDICLLSLIIHSETHKIRSFINIHLGELYESAESRTVEYFQDWAESALYYLHEMQKVLEEKTIPRIEQSELDEIDSSLSARYQALFQAKLNVLNSNIHNLFEGLNKDWLNNSDYFYQNFLGPALDFQVKVVPEISDPLNLDENKFPRLALEAKTVIGKFSEDFSYYLADLSKRNNVFNAHVTSILDNTIMREHYKAYIFKLGQKNPVVGDQFTSLSELDQSDFILLFPHPLSHEAPAKRPSTDQHPSHQSLLDREDSDAHPQYLLRSGGRITGDIEVDPGVKIGGVSISNHNHDGVNSERINGNHIVWGTIDERAVSSSATTSTPSNLHVSKTEISLVSPGVTEVEARIKFDVNPENIVGYEIELMKLD